jgi:hypothetical protein
VTKKTSAKVEYLSHALLATLVGQVAATRDIPFENLLDYKSLEVKAIEKELNNFGIHPEGLARNVLLALGMLFSSPETANRIVDVLTEELWEVLGDPQSGSPPELYRKAGVSMFTTILAILRPSDD